MADQCPAEVMTAQARARMASTPSHPWMEAEAMNPALLAAMLGHSPAVLMATYSHVRALDARDELTRLLGD